MRIGFKLSLFKRILLFFLIVVVIPTVSISSIHVYHYSIELKDKYRNRLETQLDGMSSRLEQFTAQLDRLTVQLSLLTDVDKLLAWPERANAYDYYVLQNHLREHMSMNGMIESAYVYGRLQDRVLTTNEGFYDRASFYDRTALEAFLAAGDGSRYVSRTRPTSPGTTAPPSEVITFVRSLPLSGKDALGLLVLDVNREAFFRTFGPLVQSGEGAGYIIDLRRASPLYGNGGPVAPELVAGHWAGRTSPSDRGTTIARIDGQPYFVAYRTVRPYSWLLVQVIPYAAYERELHARLRSAGQATAVVLGLGLLLSYLFALLVYNPWKHIVRRYHAVFKPASPHPRRDEYTLVREGIDRLLVEHSRVKAAIERVEPLVRHRLISDLLHAAAPDRASTARLLEQHGLAFESPHFVVCLASFDWQRREKRDEFGPLRLLLFGLVEEAFRSRLELAGTLLDEGRFAFILGLPERAVRQDGDGEARLDRETVRLLTELCRGVNETAQRQAKTGLQFSFGSIRDSVCELHESYLEALRGFKYKALLNKTDIVFMADKPGERTFPYPVWLQKLAIDAVKAGDRKRAGEAIDALFAQYIHGEAYPPEQIQPLIVLFLSAIVQELLREGYGLDELDPGHLARIDECGDNQELERFIRGHIEAIIDKLESWESKRTESDNQYVAGSIRYMEQQFDRNLSIADIAQYVGVSPNYLSRLFKAETGSSPLDHLTRIRIEQGKKLLLDERKLSLQNVGQRIGYYDVQSFIRFFKKYEGVTPTVYRKLALQERDAASRALSPHS